jgi:hypothetical protein
MDATAQIRPERTTPLRAGPGERAVGGIIAGVALAVLVIAATLRPAEAGHGTHWLASFVIQPAGMLLSVATAAAFWLGLHTLLTGSRIGSLTGWVLRPKPITVMVLGLIGAWVYKIMTWNGF